MKRIAGFVLSFALMILLLAGQAQAGRWGGTTGLAVSGPNVFTVWNDNNPGTHGLCFRRSLDGGTTWKPMVRLVEGEAFGPAIAASAPYVYVVYQYYNGTRLVVCLLRSADRGATWGVPYSLSSGVFHGSNPAIAASGSNVDAFWSESDFASFHLIGHSRSTDSGGTWSMPEVFFSDFDSRSGARAAASGPTLCVGWNEGDNGWGFFRSHEDKKVGGSIWIWVMTGVSPRENLGVDCDKDISGLIWTDGTDSQTYMARLDATNTWGPETQLSTIAWSTTDPSLRHSGASTYATWTGTTSSSQRIYFARSTDEGQTWRPDKALTPTTKHCESASLAAEGKNVYVTYWDYARTDTGYLCTLYLRVSTDMGVTWKAAKKVGTQNINIG